MQVPDIEKITIDPINDHFLQNKNVQVDVLRLDKIHPVISGNKWFKLKYHFDNFNAGNYNGILTFGGAWSNHVVGTACACYLQKINCAGIIRGEKPLQLSAALADAEQYGMKLKFVSRESYKDKDNEKFIEVFRRDFPNYYVIPEGGAGVEGEKGAAEIIGLLPTYYYTHIVCAVGTGTMFNGIRRSAKDQEVIGIVILKGWQEENNMISGKLFYDYHFGGYAKYNSGLIDFMNDLFRLANIPTDFVYTGKLAYAIYDLIKKDHFKPASKILMIHSGGLRGNASLQKGSLIF